MARITINKNTDHFFIAISKLAQHSFLMLGTYDQNKVVHLLCRVGKVYDGGSNLSCLAELKEQLDLVFFNKQSRLKDEGLSRSAEGKLPISYQAYDISFEQYLEFIQILEDLQIRSQQKKFKCYKPKQEVGTQVTMKLTSDLYSVPKVNSESVNKAVDQLNINNTCRHTAIKLVEQIQGIPVSSLVSSQFFINLPYQTTLDYGKPSVNTPFYVLPIPPAAFCDLSSEKKRVAERLYRQMERMLLIEPNSEQTQNKFNCLKRFYTTLLGQQKHSGLDELLENIINWKQSNELTLSVLRKTYIWDSFFTRQSATMKLVTEMTQDLQQQRPIQL